MSSRLSPFSYFDTKDCGFLSRRARSCCVMPLRVRAFFSRSNSLRYRGVSVDFNEAARWIEPHQ
jgi:hypothetical protein